MADWSVIGAHRYRIDADVLMWEPHGTVLPEHAAQISTLLIEQWQRYGIVYLIIDGSSSLPLQPETRRVYVDAIRKHRPEIVCVTFGAGLLVRTASTLVLRAGAAIAGVRISFQFVATQSEALYLLQVERSKRSEQS